MWHDIFTEELWNFIKKENIHTFEFTRAQSLCQERTKILFFDYLDNPNDFEDEDADGFDLE